MDILPTEINIRILSELPLTEIGVCALARCSITGRSTLRDASLQPLLWKPHYEHRYIHSDHRNEDKRREWYEGDWRKMYKTRRQLDCKVLENLKAMERSGLRERIQHAECIVHLGMDAWDALSEEARRPPPPLFQEDEDITKIQDGSPVTNLSRKYWAGELLKIIARRKAMYTWRSLRPYYEYGLKKEDSPPSFEEAFASLSSFHGVLPDEIVGHIDREAERCKAYLQEHSISLAPGAKLCNAVCAFMRVRGFGRADNTRFYDFRNSLPHLFLTSLRHTLPISLVFLYVGIMNRLGVEAIPLNTPHCVTALVRDLYVDATSEDSSSVFDMIEDSERVKQMFSEANRATDTVHMLIRAARNIGMAGTFEFGTAVPEDYYKEHDIAMWFQTQYLSQVILRLFPSGPEDWIESSISVATERNLFPLDMDLVIRDDSFALPFRINARMEAPDEGYVPFGKNMARALSSSDIDPSVLFVGQIVTKKGSSSLRCISGWKIKNGDIMCSTITHFHHRVYDFPVQILSPITCSLADIRSFVQNPILGQFFEDAEFQELTVGSEGGRGRFIMNKRFKRLYPDDDIRGACWVRNG